MRLATLLLLLPVLAACSSGHAPNGDPVTGAGALYACEQPGGAGCLEFIGSAYTPDVVAAVCAEQQGTLTAACTDEGARACVVDWGGPLSFRRFDKRAEAPECKASVAEREAIVAGVGAKPRSCQLSDRCLELNGRALDDAGAEARCAELGGHSVRERCPSEGAARCNYELDQATAWAAVFTPPYDLESEAAACFAAGGRWRSWVGPQREHYPEAPGCELPEATNACLRFVGRAFTNEVMESLCAKAGGRRVESCSRAHSSLSCSSSNGLPTEVHIIVHDDLSSIPESEIQPVIKQRCRDLGTQVADLTATLPTDTTNVALSCVLPSSCVRYSGRAWDERSATEDCSTLGGAVQAGDCGIIKGCLLEQATVYSRVEKLPDDADEALAPSFCDAKGGKWFKATASEASEH